MECIFCLNENAYFDGVNYVCPDCGRAVSYTHLDVYKRQVFLQLLVVGINLELSGFVTDDRSGSCLLYPSRCV